MPKVHPVVRLYAWLIGVLVVQRLDIVGLLAVSLVLPFLGLGVLKRGGRLVFRTRWLLVSLFGVYGLSVAGEPLWPGWFSPSYEGLIEATRQAGKLILMMMGVALVLETMSLSDWMLAARRIFEPLRRLGMSGDRFVVRLMLVLRSIETLPAPQRWRELLAESETVASEVIVVHELRLGFADWGWVSALSVCLIVVLACS